MKEKFNIVTSTCVPLPLENVDTDQIIPARFLKATTREGFGDNLFRDWRYDKAGNPNPNFVLNQDTYKGQILVAERTSVAVPAASMLPGRSPDMASGWWSAASLPISSRTIR